MSEMGNRVKQYREERNWSKQKMSQITGISPSNLYQIEEGKIYPYAGWRKRISSALGVSEEVLFPGV